MARGWRYTKLSLSSAFLSFYVLCVFVPFLSFMFCSVFVFILSLEVCRCLKKNLNPSRFSEHPPIRGKNVKMFKLDHRLQRQNLFL